MFWSKLSMVRPIHIHVIFHQMFQVHVNIYKQIVSWSKWSTENIWCVNEEKIGGQNRDLLRKWISGWRSGTNRVHTGTVLIQYIQTGDKNTLFVLCKMDAGGILMKTHIPSILLASVKSLQCNVAEQCSIVAVSSWVEGSLQFTAISSQALDAITHTDNDHNSCWSLKLWFDFLTPELMTVLGAVTGTHAHT